jgi:hypothetical protein
MNQWLNKENMIVLVLALIILAIAVFGTDATTRFIYAGF